MWKKLYIDTHIRCTCIHVHKRTNGIVHALAQGSHSPSSPSSLSSLFLHCPVVQGLTRSSARRQRQSATCSKGTLCCGAAFVPTALTVCGKLTIRCVGRSGRDVSHVTPPVAEDGADCADVSTFHFFPRRLQSIRFLSFFLLSHVVLVKAKATHTQDGMASFHWATPRVTPLHVHRFFVDMCIAHNDQSVSTCPPLLCSTRDRAFLSVSQL